MLYLVATPIGNLKDITLRALETLEKANLILCEDTRVAGRLLSHFHIKKPLQLLTDFNEAQTTPQIIAQLQKGLQIALLADAGSPLISDPGFKLVRECVQKNLPIEAVPGPSAVVTALQLSGLPPDRFSFWGYLPKKTSQRLKFLQSLKDATSVLPQTLIFFESPHRLRKALADFAQVFGPDQKIIIARELTKLHQEIRRGKLEDLTRHFAKTKPKGEITLLLRFC